FADPQAAEKTLAAVRTVPHIISASIYTKEGQLFASYPPLTETAHSTSSTKESEGTPSQVTGKDVRFYNDRMELTRPVVLDSEIIGRVTLQSDLQELYTRLQWYVISVAVVLLGGALVAYVLSSLFQRVIARPILQLAITTHMISREKNYAVRVDKYGND